MAHYSRFPDVALPVTIAEENGIQEGLAVTLSASGVRGTLNGAVIAPANAVGHVFCIFKAPDEFPRPTPEGMYTAQPYTIMNDNNYQEPVKTDTLYSVGKSVLWAPFMNKGERAIAARGGTFSIQSGAFVDSVNIRVAGAKVKVGTSGRWDYTTNATEAVGYVEEYTAENGCLVINLHQ